MFPYAVWLVPCAERYPELDSRISGLSLRFGTPAFAPHATLCSGLWKHSEEELIGAVDRLSDRPPVRLTVSGVSWADHWSTFFFIRLSRESDLFRTAGSMIAGSHAPAVGPHLSLIYCFQSGGIDRESLESEMRNDLPVEIRFGSLQMVTPSTGCWEDVAGWTPLHSVGFSG